MSKNNNDMYPLSYYANIPKIGYLDVFKRKKGKSKKMCLTKNKAHHAKIYVFACLFHLSSTELQLFRIVFHLSYNTLKKKLHYNFLFSFKNQQLKLSTSLKLKKNLSKTMICSISCNSIYMHFVNFHIYSKIFYKRFGKFKFF